MTIRCDGRIFTVAKVAGFMGGGWGKTVVSCVGLRWVGALCLLALSASI